MIFIYEYREIIMHYFTSHVMAFISISPLARNKEILQEIEKHNVIKKKKLPSTK